jgi:hypothetical protein
MALTTGLCRPPGFRFHGRIGESVLLLLLLVLREDTSRFRVMG